MTQDQSNPQSVSQQQPAAQQPVASDPITQDSKVGNLADPKMPVSGSAASSPLDQLEELIKNAQSRAGGASGGTTADEVAVAGAGGQVALGQQTIPNVSSEEPISLQQSQQNDEVELERIKQLKDQKAEEEKELVAKQQELIKQNTIESDQTQRRAEAKAEESQDGNNIPDGMIIKQLDHIKIKKPIN